MYRGMKQPSQMDQLAAKGGVISNRGVKTSGSQTYQPKSPELNKQPKIYRGFRNTAMGPLGQKHPNYSLFDLMTSMEEEDQNLLENYFEDWVFPSIRKVYNPETQRHTFYAMPERTIVRYDMGYTEEGAKIRIPKTKTQYLYVVLNTVKYPVQDFGSATGMKIGRANYLVCIEVGDPTSGYLGNAFVQYAIALGSPISQTVEVTAANYDPRYEAKPQFFYKLKGDPELEKWIFERWFNEKDHFFNATVYPKIRAFMNQ